MQTIEVFPRVDCNELQRKGKLTVGQRRVFVGGVCVKIEWLPFARGRLRAFFRCPSCGERCAVLQIKDWSCVGCRRRGCFNLVYRSQQERRFGQACLMGNKIRAKLGWEPGVGYLGMGRPRGMHQSVFERLVAMERMQAERAFSDLSVWMAKLRR